VETEFLESALKISTNTVKTLRLTAEIHPGVAAEIGDFRQLRELELTVALPSAAHKVLLSSITSIEFRKVTFSVCYMSDWGQYLEEWALIDRQLCELVDRLRATGYRHVLEVELRLTETGDPGENDFTEFLPKFREKGVVIVVDAVHGDRILHSSNVYNR